MRPDRKQLLPQGRAEPDDVQRRGRGRPAQRRDDRARRLHGRARPAAAALVLPVYFGLAIVVEEERLGDSPELRRGARPPRERRRARIELLELAEAIAPPRRWSSSTTSSTRAGRTLDRLAEPLPRARQGRAARRALPRERGPARAPRRHASSGPSRQPRSRSATRCATTRTRYDAPASSGASAPAARRRRRTVVPPVHGHGPGAARPSVERASTPCATREHRAATSPSAAPAAAAAPSSCGPTSTAHELPSRRSGSPTRSAPRPTRSPGGRAEARHRRLARRPQHRARRLRPLRPARRPRALPPGRRSRRRSPTRRSSQLALLRIGHGVGVELAPRSSGSTTARRPAASCRRRRTRRRRRATRSTRSAPDAAIAEPLEQRRRSTRASALAQGRRRRRARGRRRTGRSTRRGAGAARGPGHRRRRPLGRRRLLRHAPRGGPHAALAVAHLPARASTTSTTR